MTSIYYEWLLNVLQLCMEELLCDIYFSNARCHKLHFKLFEEKALEAQLDLDVLSGLTEIDLEAEELFGSKDIMRFGVSLRPSLTKEVSTQIVSLSSRYVVCNESEDAIAIRQCYVEVCFNWCNLVKTMVLF